MTYLFDAGEYHRRVLTHDPKEGPVAGFKMQVLSRLASAGGRLSLADGRPRAGEGYSLQGSGAGSRIEGPKDGEVFR